LLTILISAHLVIAMAAAGLTRLIGHRAFLLVAVLPAATFGWLVAQAPVVLAGGAVSEVAAWIPALRVELSFRLGLVQWLLALVVTGIGAVVLWYCRWYFAGVASQPRVVGLLTAFCAAMIGLVTADDLILLYVFWEATTVFSYLLIGHDPTRRANRSAALTALIVTTTGGLAMLVGLIALGQAAGTNSLAAIVAAPPSGALVMLAAPLILAGALSKSALAPFHFWLPGAMAAPTPISAYLHAAAMVKAGVYLVAVFAPVLAGQPGWRPAVWTLGALTLFLGGWRALRQDDLKLLLAYGTVSQLGLLVLLVGTGTQAAALGGMAMLIAHALFKATAFLVVGIVDHGTGTRQLSELSGVGRSLPLTATVAGIAAASMAGLPPTLGFIAKEAGLEGITNLGLGHDGTGIAALPAWLLIGVVVAGCVLDEAGGSRHADQPPPGGRAAGRSRPAGGRDAGRRLPRRAADGRPAALRRHAPARRTRPRPEADPRPRRSAGRVRGRDRARRAAVRPARPDRADPADLSPRLRRRRLLPGVHGGHRPARR